MFIRSFVSSVGTTMRNPFSWRSMEGPVLRRGGTERGSAAPHQNRRQSSAPALPATCCTLPNGVEVKYFNQDETIFIYNEIYTEKVYLRHGVQLRPGDTVVDVGGNIGLFSMYAREHIDPSGRVLTLEPIPWVHDVCRHNLNQQSAAFEARGGLALPPVEVLQLAAGSQPDSELTFTAYDMALGWSSCVPDDEEVKRVMTVYLDNALSSNGGGGGGGNSSGAEGGSAAVPGEAAAAVPGEAPLSLQATWLLRVGRFLRQTPAMWWLYRLLAPVVVSQMLASGRRVRCPVDTLSRILDRQGIADVGLLKIDVERAELEVLRGVEPRTWRRVRCVALEVHDMGGTQLDTVLELLASTGGFERSRVVAEQSRELKGTSLYNVYAWRD